MKTPSKRGSLKTAFLNTLIPSAPRRFVPFLKTDPLLFGDREILAQIEDGSKK
jgi:hypothetical protein